MSALVFVDSNVLVYRHDRDEVARQARAHEIMAALWRSRAGRVSVQVLHEFYVVATRKLARPVPREAARAEVRQLTTWRPVPSTPELRERAWHIEERWQLSFWDALIVAAAEHAGCERLLTEALQDGLDVEGVLVENPFREGFAL